MCLSKELYIRRLHSHSSKNSHHFIGFALFWRYHEVPPPPPSRRSLHRGPGPCLSGRMPDVFWVFFGGWWKKLRLRLGLQVVWFVLGCISIYFATAPHTYSRTPPPPNFSQHPRSRTIIAMISPLPPGGLSVTPLCSMPLLTTESILGSRFWREINNRSGKKPSGLKLYN